MGALIVCGKVERRLGDRNFDALGRPSLRGSSRSGAPNRTRKLGFRAVIIREKGQGCLRIVRTQPPSARAIRFQTARYLEAPLRFCRWDGDRFRGLASFCERGAAKRAGLDAF